MIKESYHWTDEFSYIFDSKLHDLLQSNRETKRLYVHTGLNVTTHQQFWQYKSSGDVSTIGIAFEEEVRGKRLSLGRWTTAERKSDD